MPQPRRRTGFAQKAKPRRFITEISLADDFQCHGAVQIDVDRLVSDAHCTATQLGRCSIFALHQFIMLKALRCLFRCGLECILRRRLAGLNPVSESLAKHADRTEFHCSRKLVTASRAGALGLRAHGLTVLRPQSEPKATPRSTEWCESGRDGPWQTVVPLHKQLGVNLYSASNHV